MSDEEEITLEGTLALIKPDAVPKEAHIMERIKEEGFLLVERLRFRFTEDLAKQFYAQFSSKPYFDDLIQYMTSGDTVALCLARKDGIEHWKHVLGPARVSEAMRHAPNSLRARYGNSNNDMINALHGSEDPESSEREIELIFPHILHGQSDDEDSTSESDRRARSSSTSTLDRSMSRQTDDHKAYLQKYVCPTLLKGLTEMYDTRPQSPLTWLAEWLEENNPNRD